MQNLKLALTDAAKDDRKYLYGISGNGEIYIKIRTPIGEKKLTLVLSYYPIILANLNTTKNKGCLLLGNDYHNLRNCIKNCHFFQNIKPSNQNPKGRLEPITAPSTELNNELVVRLLKSLQIKNSHTKAYNPARNSLVESLTGIGDAMGGQETVFVHSSIRVVSCWAIWGNLAMASLGIMVDEGRVGNTSRTARHTTLPPIIHSWFGRTQHADVSEEAKGLCLTALGHNTSNVSSTFVPRNHVNRKGAVVGEPIPCSPPTKANQVQSPGGSLRIFASGNCYVGPWVFSGISLYRCPFIPTLFHTHHTSPSSLLTTSLLRAIQISPQSHTCNSRGKVVPCFNGVKKHVGDHFTIYSIEFHFHSVDFSHMVGTSRIGVLDHVGCILYKNTQSSQFANIDVRHEHVTLQISI
ncbi:hypothetical protein PR048_028384 [Dryococelus australis]|uniref:Uncharacterized protein n=1 Tax=Dryococelus australis TaxID=614101 RepID=A0ABQ9GJ67_9NEOP|nr:hypothetical protein PR048_028384 [Dryococelus australis]